MAVKHGAVWKMMSVSDKESAGRVFESARALSLFSFIFNSSQRRGEGANGGAIVMIGPVLLR